MRVRVSPDVQQSRADPKRGILERLPEGDDDEHDVFVRSKEQLAEDEAADDGGE